MSTFQSVTVVGNIGSLELRYTASGRPVLNMRVATSESWKDKEGKAQERTEWHRVVVWGEQAENANKYLVKGQQVIVVGKNRTRSYEKDGQKHYVTEISGDSITYGNKPRAKNEQSIANDSSVEDSPADTDIPL